MIYKTFNNPAKVAEILREARDELQRDNDAAKAREHARMLGIAQDQCDLLREWIGYGDFDDRR